MSRSALAITEEHHELAEVAIRALSRLRARAAARATLDDETSHPADIWSTAADLGWNGLAISEQYGGSGFGIDALAIVLEAQGHELCPGPFLPTVAASLVIDRCGADSLRSRVLPNLADGSSVGALGLSGTAVLGSDLRVSGEVPAVLGAPDADLLVCIAGEDVVIVGAQADGVNVTPHFPVWTPPAASAS